MKGSRAPRKKGRFLVVLGYLVTIPAVLALLVLGAYALNGFRLSDLGIPLLGVAILALLVGLLLGSGYSAWDLTGLLSREGWRNRGGEFTAITPMEDYEQAVKRMAGNLPGVSRDEIDAQDPANIRAGRNRMLASSLIAASILACAGRLLIERLMAK
jgi:hypothetical protein